jgi:hypothetical protein
VGLFLWGGPINNTASFCLGREYTVPPKTV